MSTPLIVANWKMELSHKAALEALTALKKLLKGVTLTTDVVICPSFPTLSEAATLVAGSKKLQLGAQNVHWEERGAWTGEVSVVQLNPFVTWCIVGHSERRALTQETDTDIHAKAALLLKHGITPIVCIGESQAERQQEQTVAKITHQLDVLMTGLNRIAMGKVVIAYEPLWAIGTGETPDPGTVTEVMLLVRKLIAERFESDVAQKVRLLYGGSVTSDNVASFVSEPGVDGALVGGASIRPMQLVEIVKRVQAAK